MSNWKDVAYLFANGKFKVRFRGRVCDVFNYSPTLRSFHIRNEFWPRGKTAFIGEETLFLIARRIEDLTDDEKLEFCREVGYTSAQETWQEVVSDYADAEERNSSYTYDSISREEYENQLLRHLLDSIPGAMHALSIGVYPFPWNETIIERKRSE